MKTLVESIKTNLEIISEASEDALMKQINELNRKISSLQNESDDLFAQYASSDDYYEEDEYYDENSFWSNAPQHVIARNNEIWEEIHKLEDKVIKLRRQLMNIRAKEK